MAWVHVLRLVALLYGQQQQQIMHENTSARSSKCQAAFQLQLRTAVYREDYRSAYTLKLAIAATAKNYTGHSNL
jgi:hypothetical protein